MDEEESKDEYVEEVGWTLEVLVAFSLLGGGAVCCAVWVGERVTWV